MVMGDRHLRPKRLAVIGTCIIGLLVDALCTGSPIPASRFLHSYIIRAEQRSVRILLGLNAAPEILKLPALEALLLQARL